jgi:hypothetical protein
MNPVKIENILADLFENIQVNDNKILERVKQIFFSNIDEDIKKYLQIVDLKSEVVYIGVNNTIVFSEIVAFRKLEINKKILPLLEEIGVKEIRFKNV